MRKQIKPHVPQLSADFNATVTHSLASELGLSSSIQDSLLTGKPVSHEHLAKRDPSTLDRFEFMLGHLRNEVFSKYPFVIPGVDRKKAAIDKFMAAESDCAAANGRLVDWSTRPSIPFGTFRRAGSIIRSILGRFNPDELPEQCGFGPGASTSLRRSRSSQQNKWVRSTHITAGALPYYRAFYRYCNGTSDLPGQVLVVEGNKVTTVPKNSLTDRVIAVEPDWNMFFQKGVGSMIRRRLQKKAGLLHPDAQYNNQRLALIGSCASPQSDQDYVTIDLSAASDSISLALCEALVPKDWLKVLYDLRSPLGQVGRNQVSYEKISSMGNGFTFELETLLFFGLCRAVCQDGQVLVYGDDIIVPWKWASEVIATLEVAGFRVNLSKTFTSGCFRESCGGHYFRGHDVTPFYVRRRVDTLGDAVDKANQIYLWSARYGNNVYLDELLYHSHDFIRRSTPREFRGPAGMPGCLWSNWDESTPEWCTDTQSFKYWAVVREHRYAFLGKHTGAFLYKLWENSPELQASLLAKAVSREVSEERFVDRGQWSKLMAWSLCQ